MRVESTEGFGESTEWIIYNVEVDYLICPRYVRLASLSRLLSENRVFCVSQESYFLFMKDTGSFKEYEISYG